MRKIINKADQNADDLHLRDAIIHGLYVRLKAERETREAIAEAARHGAHPDVIEAMASDPVPLIDELGQSETVDMLLRRFREAGTALPAQAVINGD